MKEHDDTTEEDRLALVYAQIPAGDPRMQHLALMDKSFVGFPAKSSRTRYKFMTGPDQGGMVS